MDRRISCNSVTIINSNIGAILTSLSAAISRGENIIAFKPIAPNLSVELRANGFLIQRDDLLWYPIVLFDAHTTPI